MLVRSRSNYITSIEIKLLLQDGQCKFYGFFFGSIAIENYLAHDELHALSRH